MPAGHGDPAEPGSVVRMPSPDSALPEVAAVARDLIRFDTTNHGGGRAAGEREAAEYVGAYLETLGLDAGVLRADPAPHERHGARARPRSATSPRSSCTATSTSSPRSPRTGASTRSPARSATGCCGAAAPST